MKSVFGRLAERLQHVYKYDDDMNISYNLEKPLVFRFFGTASSFGPAAVLLREPLSCKSCGDGGGPDVPPERPSFMSNVNFAFVMARSHINKEDNDGAGTWRNTCSNELVQTISSGGGGLTEDEIMVLGAGVMV